MEVTTTVKVSDLTNLFDQFSYLRSEIKQLKESEEQLKAFSIQQTAKMLNLHYNSVRKLIINHKLFAKSFFLVVFFGGFFSRVNSKSENTFMK